MTRLNLLPWREQRRKEQDRLLLRRGGLAWIGAALVILYLHMYLVGQLHRQQRRNAFLQQAIAQMNAKVAQITKIRKQGAELMARMNVIKKLQGDRMQTVHAFNALVRAVPSGVYLKSLNQNGSTFTVSGVAQSNERVSQLMRNFAASPWFAKPVLTVIHVVPVGNGHLSLFTLAVQGADKLAKKTTAKRVVRR
ncbi:MAG: PilN domain-containing protein [Gammaproteobacteria bacterium]|nr:PilN domain-containing protein [Gammaproteobacteria bacterium]